LHRAAALSDDALLRRLVDLADRLGKELRAASAFPSALAARSFLTWVLSSERFLRFRARRFSPCLICFRADAWCATLSSPPKAKKTPV
jgi:hypothetical protein